MRSDDAAEGMRAFAEKRAPRWTGADMTVDRRPATPEHPDPVGVGQASDPIDAADYHRWGAVDLAATAAAAALADAGLDGDARRHRRRRAAVRDLDPGASRAAGPLRQLPALGGAAGRRRRRDARCSRSTGGQAPQHLITEFAKAIARGEADTVLIFGSEAISTTRACAGRDDAPDFTEHVGGDLEDRGYGLEGLMEPVQLEHGLIDGAAAVRAARERAPRPRRR